MFFSFAPTEILYISSRVLLYVFNFNFFFCEKSGLEKKKQTNKQKQQKNPLEIRIEIPSKEENAKIEISPIIVEAIIRKCSI